MSQEQGRWVWMEIRVLRMFCCTPEMCVCRGCFQKLNAHHANGQTKVKDKTGQRGRGDRRKERRQEGSSRCAHRRERQQVRREKRGGWEEKREGQMKQENQHRAILYRSFIPGCVYFLGLR